MWTKEFTAWNNEFTVVQMHELFLCSPIHEQRGTVFVEQCLSIGWNSKVVVLYVKNFRLFKVSFTDTMILIKINRFSSSKLLSTSIFSTNAALEIFTLNLSSDDTVMPLSGTVASEHR